MIRPQVMTLAATLVAIASASGTHADAPSVSLLHMPDRVVQPQAIIDANGVVHIVAFKGEPGGGDILYWRRDAANGRLFAPIRVNSEAGSAVAMGTIRGPQLALGRGGLIHVAWNGSNQSKTKNAFGSTPMLYTRSNLERTEFEPQRNLMKVTSALDGGGSIAADPEGRVIVAWHANAEGSADGESGRRLYVARSVDDGRAFAEERPAIDLETGACACCGTRSLADTKGNVFVLYRAATTGVHRDLYLLHSRDAGKAFVSSVIHPWRIDACPMSSESLAVGGNQIAAAWETAGRVYFARIDPVSGKASEPIAPSGGPGRKHPSVAINATGELLLAWTEGTGWQRGGNLAWQIFDREGKPIGKPGRVEGGIPVWGLPSAVALPDGSFLLVH